MAALFNCPSSESRNFSNSSGILRPAFSGRRPAFSDAARNILTVLSSMLSNVALGSITSSHVLPDFFNRNSFNDAPVSSCLVLPLL